MDVSNFEITTNIPKQNDILDIQIRFIGLENHKFSLITLTLVGVLEHKNEEIVFLQSIPVVLTVLSKIDDQNQNQVIQYYIPKRALPSYHTKNFDISYHLLLNITCDDNSNYTFKKEFYVQHCVYDFFDSEKMIIISEDYWNIPKNKDFRKEYLQIVERELDKNFEKFITSSDEEKVNILTAIVDNSKILDNYTDCRYNNNLENYIQEDLLSFPHTRTFTIKENETPMCEIKIDDIIYINCVNTIYFKFFKNINEIKFKIYCYEKETQFDMDFKEKIFSDEVYVNFCVEKSYKFFMPYIKNFTFSCSQFISKFILNVILDKQVFEIPIKIIQNNDCL